MNSSTSASERASVRIALTAFVCGVAALLVPYEMLVRTSERVYGVRPANIVMPRTLSPKIDQIINDFDQGVRYATIAVGTSRMEWSLRPDVVEASLGPTYNAGCGGISSVVMLEFLHRLGPQPQRLIVSVSPLDFTQIEVRQAERGIGLSRLTSPESENHSVNGRGPAAWSRTAVRAVLHSSSPERRRNLGQWLELFRDHGSVLAFLNNQDATGAINGMARHGYRPAMNIATPEQIFQPRPAMIADDYRSASGTLFPRFAAALRSFQQRGTTVTLVRLPTGIGTRRAEDAETTFDGDMRELSRACGVSYIDSSALMGAAFSTDRRDFSDSEHLNSAGALQFSRALAQVLMREPSPQL
jgi:hypothetical protein